MTEQDFQRAQEVGRVLGVKNCASTMVDGSAAGLFILRMVEKKGVPTEPQHRRALIREIVRAVTAGIELAAACKMEKEFALELESYLQRAEEASIRRLEARREINRSGD